MEYQDLKTAIENKGFVFFDEGNYNLNFIWVRNDYIFTNMFTDTLYIAYKEDGNEKVLEFKATTKAALYSDGGALNPVAGGTAIIKAGQYRASWHFTMGNGTGTLPWGKPYFQQVRGIDYFRDNNKDNVVDEVNEQDNKIFGTNWHIMAEPLGVNKSGSKPWSEGCMGVSLNDMLNTIVPLVHKSIPIWGDVFTGTIIDAEDLNV